MSARLVASAGMCALASLASLASFATGCAPRPDPLECRAMLDRYVEMSARSDPALASTPPDVLDDRVREIVATKRAETAYADARGRCQREVSASEYQCAMKAPTPNEWEACVQ